MAMHAWFDQRLLTWILMNFITILSLLVWAGVMGVAILYMIHLVEYVFHLVE